MIPLRDNIPTRRFPWITVTLILLNVAIFLADWFTGHYEQVRVRIPGGGIAEGLHFVGGFSETYSLVPSQVTSNLADSWPTLITHMFLHANWLHIGGTCLTFSR